MTVQVDVNDLEIKIESKNTASTGSFKMIFDIAKETGMIPLSTDSQERELVKKYQDNQDPETLKEIIKCSMRIILVSLKDIVLRNLNSENAQYVDFKEIFKAAFQGVKRAAKKFKTDKKNRLTTIVIQSVYPPMQKKITRMIDKKVVQPEYISKNDANVLQELLYEMVPKLK